MAKPSSILRLSGPRSSSVLIEAMQRGYGDTGERDEETTEDVVQALLSALPPELALRLLNSSAFDTAQASSTSPADFASDFFKQEPRTPPEYFGPGRRAFVGGR